jgi:hypothetical protein
LETEVHLHNIHNLVHITQSTHCPPFQPLCFKELEKCNLQQSSIKNTEIHFHFMLKCYTSTVRLIKHPSHFNVFTLSSRGYAAAQLPKLRVKATHKFMFYNLIPTTVSLTCQSFLILDTYALPYINFTHFLSGRETSRCRHIVSSRN